MDKTESLSHSKWECKYHVVFIPKCRRKALYGELRKHLGEVFRRLPLQRFPADGSAKIDTVVTVLTRDARYQTLKFEITPIGGLDHDAPFGCLDRHRVVRC